MATNHANRANSYIWPPLAPNNFMSFFLSLQIRGLRGHGQRVPHHPRRRSKSANSIYWAPLAWWAVAKECHAPLRPSLSRAREKKKYNPTVPKQIAAAFAVGTGVPPYRSKAHIFRNKNRRGHRGLFTFQPTTRPRRCCPCRMFSFKKFYSQETPNGRNAPFRAK